MTGIPHPTARRLAMELVAAGALERREDGRFTVGLRLWQLGTPAPLTESLRTLAQPFMEDLHSALHQHVQLAVREGHEAAIIQRLSAPHALGVVAPRGGRMSSIAPAFQPGALLWSYFDIWTVTRGSMSSCVPVSNR